MIDPTHAVISIVLTEDSCGRYWARVVQADPVSDLAIRTLNQRFKTHKEALSWANRIATQWKKP